jgi:hypothetical protein
MAELVHPEYGQDIAGYGGDGEDRELDGDGQCLGGVRGDELDDLRGRDRVALRFESTFKVKATSRLSKIAVSADGRVKGSALRRV